MKLLRSAWVIANSPTLRCTTILNSQKIEGATEKSELQQPLKIPWNPQRSETWLWKDPSSGESINVNYISRGRDKPGTPLVFIHGFGASSYHWRYQLPVLDADRPVFALDLVGFGLTDKPLVEYSAELWRDQVGAFLDEVVQQPSILAGNSLGGFTALYVAAEFPARTAACVLLNAAGRFSSPNDESQDTKQLPERSDEARDNEEKSLWVSFKEALSKAVIYGSFFFTKQPQRIAQVLRQVYSVNAQNVDADLIESIRFPAGTSPTCAEVFYRVIKRTSSGRGATIDALLPKLTFAGTPLHLVWGEEDPWIRPAVADKIQSLKPDATRFRINAGHCPHDEKPAEVNAALAKIALASDARRGISGLR